MKISENKVDFKGVWFGSNRKEKKKKVCKSSSEKENPLPPP